MVDGWDYWDDAGLGGDGRGMVVEGSCQREIHRRERYGIMGTARSRRGVDEIDMCRIYGNVTLRLRELIKSAMNFGGIWRCRAATMPLRALLLERSLVILAT